MVTYSRNTFKKFDKQLQEDILKAPQSLPNLRNEIRRVFQQANRRIQNIEKTGLISPAVTALNKGNITGYSKFSFTGYSWDDLKKEYTKALTFLQQPTSTAGGTRTYAKSIQQKYKLNDEQYKILSQYLQKRLTTIEETDFVERYLMNYGDITGDIEQAAGTAGEQIESESQVLTEQLNNQITQSAVDALTNPAADEEGLSNAVDFLFNLDEEPPF